MLSQNRDFIICVLQGDGYIDIGQVSFVLVEPPPLTPERVAAIRADPYATKGVRYSLGCKYCPSKFNLYSALDKDNRSEDGGWIWYQDLPDKFICECKKTEMDLTILRRNFHALLGRKASEVNNKNIFLNYELSSLKTISINFLELLESNPREELLQQFINENPVLLHQFPSNKTFVKPPILTKYFADFGIVTPQKELVLIELEKTSTRLLKKNGDTAADLNHAFDQIRDWLHEADEHRLAFLDSLNIEKSEVSAIRGVVIAGRDKGNDAEDLRKLKGMDRGKITMLTYDDLLISLDILIAKMDSL
ncbi:MAG: DUF4263 domain-containing protein [Nitrospina sp.]|nr:DUF4263 domain-containing protein [Nitrospina sp.]